MPIVRGNSLDIATLLHPIKPAISKTREAKGMMYMDSFHGLNCEEAVNEQY